MRRITTPCKCCGTAKDGMGEYCVLCYERAIVPCPKCTNFGLLRPRVRQKRRPDRGPIDCAHCNNERWLLDPLKLKPIGQSKSEGNVG